MKSRFLQLIVVTMCLISISGCGAMGALDSRNLADKLERSLTHYASALRWGRHREAVSFHVTRDGKTAEVYLDHIEQFSVTSFEFISKEIIPSSVKEGITEAIIIGEMKYFHKEQGTIRELDLTQIWWYNREINTWLIETDFPEFK